MNPSPQPAGNQFQLWFKPLSNTVSGLTFPCDVMGCVDLDALHGCERLNYLYARALIGLDFERPKILPNNEETHRAMTKASIHTPNHRVSH